MEEQTTTEEKQKQIRVIGKHRHINLKKFMEEKRRQSIYDAMQKDLESIYNVELRKLCERFIKETENEENRSYALLERIQRYFQDEKKYDWDYYNYAKRRGGFNDDVWDYIKCKYNIDNGEEKDGYYTPNDKKMILLTDTMICSGCADLVEDILNYCNKKKGINIAHFRDSSIVTSEYSSFGHGWNEVAVRKNDGRIYAYEFDMSKGVFANTVFRIESNSEKKEALTNQLETLETLEKEKPESKLYIIPKTANESRLHITISPEYIEEIEKINEMKANKPKLHIKPRTNFGTQTTTNKPRLHISPSSEYEQQEQNSRRR